MKAAPVTHGIEPVPARLCVLRTFDNALLWASLSVGLLVLVSGGLLVPALGLGRALLAVAIGSLVGGLLLGAIAALAARERVPGMVLLRAPLGVHGSLLPTLLNVVQNFGWSVFELIVIAHAARAAAGGSLALWTVLGACMITALALGGPLVVVRRVLRLVGAPVTLGAAIYLTAWAASRLHWHAASHGHGGLGFWLAVDLAIALPISWAPLVADYARFSRTPRGAMVGTALGSAAANAWFYGLGAMLVLVGAANSTYGLTAAAGVLVLGLLALAELDKPFADLYSTVISIKNARPGWPGPPIAVVLGAGALACALTLPITDYEGFLLLLGSCFVPLAGVLLAYALRAGPFDSAQLYRPDGRYGGVRFANIAAWLAGFILYQWIAPSSVAGWQHAVHDVQATLGVGAAPAWLARYGASLPSLVLSAALAVVLFGLGGRVRSRGVAHVAAD